MENMNESMSYLIHKWDQKVSKLAQFYLSDTKLTPAQALCLNYLYTKDGINQNELGEKLGKDRTTISGILTRLEAIGYLTRETDEKDKRSSIIYLTQKAWDKEEELDRIKNIINTSAAKDLTETELQCLITILNKINK